MKKIVRTLIPIAVATVFVYLLSYFNFIDFSSISEKGFAEPQKIIEIAACQIAVLLILSLRYQFLLSKFQQHTSYKNVLSATVVSTAIGQWAPASIGIMEIIRLSLLKSSDKNDPQRDKFSLMSTAVVSFLDRTSGFIAMLLIGSVMSTLLWFSLKSSLRLGKEGLAILALGFSSLFIATAALFSGRIFNWIPFLQRDLFPEPSTPIPTLKYKIFSFLNKLLKVVRSFSQKMSSPKQFLVPVSFGFVSTMISIFSFYLSAQISGFDIGFWAIAAVLPMVSLSSIFPLGFAGLGGQQFVAILLFSTLNIPAQAAAQASFIQNALSLATYSIFGMFFMRKVSRSLLKNFLAKKENLESGPR